MNLACFNDKHRQYNDILKRIKLKRIPKFNTGGRLCICLVEFRNMIEIDYVIRAVLKQYSCDYEIGLSVVCFKQSTDDSLMISFNFSVILYFLSMTLYNISSEVPYLADDLTFNNFCIIV